MSRLEIRAYFRLLTIASLLVIGIALISIHPSLNIVPVAAISVLNGNCYPFLLWLLHFLVILFNSWLSNQVEELTILVYHHLIQFLVLICFLHLVWCLRWFGYLLRSLIDLVLVFLILHHIFCVEKPALVFSLLDRMLLSSSLCHVLIHLLLLSRLDFERFHIQLVLPIWRGAMRNTLHIEVRYLSALPSCLLIRASGVLYFYSIHTTI